MLRVLVQMVRIPTVLFVYGMEALIKTVQGVERAAVRGLDSIGADGAEGVGWNATSDAQTNFGYMAAGGSRDTLAQQTKGMTAMIDDQDLSGDDLKTVRYRILFTKRDLEAELDKGEEVINYPTSGGSLGALKILDFGKRCGNLKRPAPWRAENYPPDYQPNPKETGWVIPPADQKYIDFQYEVIRREERKPTEYDRELVKAARDIAANVSKLKAGNE